MSREYRRLSLWHDTLPERELIPRSPLPGSTSADVVIVGAGYTGMWTAYYLKTLQPDLDVAVIEAEIAGFGASGRNGGWLSAEFAVNRRRVSAAHGRAAVTAMFRQAQMAIDEVARVAAAEDIDCHLAKSGTLTFAVNPAQATRLLQGITEEQEWGFGEEDFRWIERRDLAEQANCPVALGAVFTPHCAAIHPARLARGLASAIERQGVKVYEQTRARRLDPGRVTTDRGDVTAPIVLGCTEAFTALLPGCARALAPVYSLMVATEPLDPSVWAEIGLAHRPTFNDGCHLIDYGQRTADGRFAFGGRGAPYHFGSTIRSRYDQHPATHRAVAQLLRGLFPQIGDARITHTWGGPVAVPRDWTASVRFDRKTGLGGAGGYVGSGVSITNLAGRTLADLVLGRETDLVELPWVGHQSRRWEPEPLRYLGINLARMLAPAADRMEERTGRPSRVLAGTLDWLTGH